MAVPDKYKTIGDFQEYYSGSRVAPYLTIFMGGNHEASNHLSELYYGGWVAPNIYYLGASGVIRCGPLRIGGLSGIFAHYDYRKTHHERLPYSSRDIRSIYHVRELEVRKLLQVRSQVDLGLSHDWPNMAVYSGDYRALLHEKTHFRSDIEKGELGSPAAQSVLDHLRPSLWFSAHLHCKYLATIDHEKKDVASVPWPEPQPAPEPKEVVTADKEKISAWQQFYQVASQQETEQNQRYWDKKAEHNKRVEAGEATNVSEMTYNLTWKKVGVGSDGLDRQVTDVIKSDGERNKTQANESTQEPAAKNTDEIELDLDSGSEASVHEPPASDQPGTSTHEGNPAPKASLDPDQSISKPGPESEGSRPVGAGEETPTAADELDQKLSEQAAEAQQGPDAPSSIDNKVTNFLALDKCLKKRRFLQLVSLPAISNPDRVEEKKPYELKYDKEWLAITRAFANELVIGDQSAPYPDHKGDAHYRKEIRAAEQWVGENIVKQGKMTIPQNFAQTAPVYDRSVSVWTTDQPPEYMNPQTEEFCNLLGIENKFKMTDEQKQAQDEAINTHNLEEPKRRQEGRQNNRGGHRGGNRGGNRGRRGGRHFSGRGRGQH